MEKPTVSPQFTMEDIYRLREYHYNLTKSMEPKERADYYNRRGSEFLMKMQTVELNTMEDKIRKGLQELAEMV